MWPGYSPKNNTDLIKIGYITQLTENSVIQIGFEIKKTFLPTLCFNIYPVTGQWPHTLDIPMHTYLIMGQFYMAFHHLQPAPSLRSTRLFAIQPRPVPSEAVFEAASH